MECLSFDIFPYGPLLTHVVTPVFTGMLVSDRKKAK